MAMQLFPVRSDRTSLSVTDVGGQLSDVTFTLADGRQVRPMHVAPWANEPLAEELPPILRVLRGDFFCAPFGSSDVIPGETRVHGLPASGNWRVTNSSANKLDALLDGKVLGATVAKHVEVRPGETVVYQRHTLTGGSGRVPYGHHAMLHADGPLALAFSKRIVALTPPEPVETPPDGYPLLTENQVIEDLHRAARPGGGTVDLTTFPSPDGFEALWMVLSDQGSSFAWTAATALNEGWVWFGLKNPRLLPQTLVWFSNGGRLYSPWNGRHRHCVGLEEICGYFHIGHATSVADNPVAARGSRTAVDLDPDKPFTVSYIFGMAAAPAGFGAVADIQPASGGIKLIDGQGREAFAACDPAYLAG